MARPFDLVMFDLDGTLIDTAPEIADAVNDTLLRFDWPEVTLEQVTQWIGHGTLSLLAQVLAHVSQKDVETVRGSSMFAWAAQAFAQHYHQRCGSRSQLYPLVRETLQGLRAQGVRVAVVTNKESAYTTRVLQAHQLQPLLDTVISGDSLPTKKPDPAGIASCRAQWRVPMQRALMVGDSSIDVATARNAGVAVWAVPYGYNMGEPIAHSNPDRIVANCAALLER